MATYSCSKPSEYKAQKKTKLKGSFNVERFNFFYRLSQRYEEQQEEEYILFSLTIKHYVKHRINIQKNNYQMDIQIKNKQFDMYKPQILFNIYISRLTFMICLKFQEDFITLPYVYLTTDRQNSDFQVTRVLAQILNSTVKNS